MVCPISCRKLGDSEMQMAENFLLSRCKKDRQPEFFI